MANLGFRSFIAKRVSLTTAFPLREDVLDAIGEASFEWFSDLIDVESRLGMEKSPEFFEGYESAKEDIEDRLRKEI